jgi:hypothetical protein
MATPSESFEAVRAQTLSTRELLGEISGKATLLVRKEVELAQTEMRADVQAELAAAKGLAVAAVLAMAGVSGLVTAGMAALALAVPLPFWVAALVVAGVLLFLAAVVGLAWWRRRVTRPLALTRKTLDEDMQWAKEQLT